MSNLELLKSEIQDAPKGQQLTGNYLMYLGYLNHLDDAIPVARGYAIESLFTKHHKHIYCNDLIAGSIRGKLSDKYTQSELNRANQLVASYGQNNFGTNADHFAADFETVLSIGVEGMYKEIEHSLIAHKDDKDFDKKKDFLNAAAISMKAFGKMITQYGEAAQEKAQATDNEVQKANLMAIANSCIKCAKKPPETFQDALQLMWLIHISFLYEGRYAMALGRMDQYLCAFYLNDIKNGMITRERALELVECTLYKIGENRYFGGDDVVNICIAGLKPDGEGGLNELTYIILEAVKNCNIPGPNLSARLYTGIPDVFIDECLKVIGTGLGYPALMNDDINIPALHRHGYTLEDSRNYCMVGCIENFIQGKQPPWSDGRYNVPKYIELALNRGICMQTGMQMGPDSGEASSFADMDDFMKALKQQMTFGAAEYMAIFRNENDRYNKISYTQPYLSCYCRCCIERGLDINDGGALYPSVHGACGMGIATVADSLAAIEQVVFNKKLVSIDTLKQALLNDYEEYSELRTALLHAPKYGNNDDFVDKYAVWYVTYLDSLFAKYRTRDGGAIYIAIASNTSNIPAGAVVAATPDGRKCGQPLSDAASPMYGKDLNGPTAVMQSMSKPDYKLVSCGTVLNQKYSPSMFSVDDKRAKLLALIKLYFKKGGQEIQINAISREVLTDAMEHPANYKSLVVRVSGFSAYYTCLDKSIQQDILHRTEHE